MYTLIKTKKQYNLYCNILETLIDQNNKIAIDEIELLSVLIEKWDKDHNTFNDLNPIELIKFLMNEKNLKPKNLVEILGLTKGTISKILNYQKGLSKSTIRNLSDYFSVSQEAFNRNYDLVNNANRPKVDIMNSNKDINIALTA